MQALLIWAWKNINAIRKALIWLSATLVFLGITGFVVWDQNNIAKTALLPGTSTNGHYQFEQACNTCHTPFDGVPTKSCTQCHAEELKQADDSHRAKVFRDPRNAADLEKINAMECTTCHNEHSPEKVTELGVTIANDFCIHCHEKVADDRPSHKNLKFNNCRQCHNYHDNRALHEDHLEKHTNEPNTFVNTAVPLRTEKQFTTPPLQAKDLDWQQASNEQITQAWSTTRHAAVSINCSHCHQNPSTKTFTEATTIDSCKRCHTKQTEGFLAGKHGITTRIDPASSMSPSDARQPMYEEVLHKQLGCTSCHSDHTFDTRIAAVEPCMKCHADTHTQAYKQSKHYQLYLTELDSNRPTGKGVSCATCHMPRLKDTTSGSDSYYVQHNQNDNLRPNSKMVREVCQHCHGLEFTLNALADPALIENNFQETPSIALKSIPMVISRKNKKKITQTN